MNNTDHDIHNFIVNGNFTVFPKGTDVDTGVVIAGNQAVDAAGGLWTGSTAIVKGPWYARLHKIMFMGQTPAAAATVAIKDNAGNNVYVYTFAADAADKDREFPGGLPLPKGGLGVLPSAGQWQFFFSWSSPPS